MELGLESRNPECLHLPTNSSHSLPPHTQPLYIALHDEVAWLCFGLPEKPALLPGQHPGDCEQAVYKKEKWAGKTPDKSRLEVTAAANVVFLEACTSPFVNSGPREAGRPMSKSSHTPVT